jgi:hypothetical protein
MRVVLAALVLALGTGCMRGLIYTNTTVPLSTNFRDTPAIASRAAAGDVKELRYRFVELAWDENAIGALARERELAEIYYADLQTFSLFGIWTQRRVRVYGLPPESLPP